jgi:hypothetical protein
MFINKLKDLWELVDKMQQQGSRAIIMVIG